MSRESYIRGFCKAAEARGVDPQELAKFAQQYKTEGYAPEMTPPWKVEKVNIPFLNDVGGRVSEKTVPEISHLTAGGERSRDAIVNPNFKARMALNPKFKNWVDAHTNAAQKAVAPLKGIAYPLHKEIPSDIGDMLSKIYHDEMKRTTSAPPAQVSAPTKRYPRNETFPSDISLLETIRRNEMRRMASALPVQVSAPAKK